MDNDGLDAFLSEGVEDVALPFFEIAVGSVIDLVLESFPPVSHEFLWLAVV